MPGQEGRFIHLTRDEAKELAEHLLAFAAGNEVEEW
jgi:dihydrodipicolinate synthase/N-acetylneuraminate lyase